MRSGDRPGLQNRRAAGLPVVGGFDPHSLPPFIFNNLTANCPRICVRIPASNRVPSPPWRHNERTSTRGQSSGSSSGTKQPAIITGKKGMPSVAVRNGCATPATANNSAYQPTPVPSARLKRKHENLNIASTPARSSSLCPNRTSRRKRPSLTRLTPHSRQTERGPEQIDATKAEVPTRFVRQVHG